MLYMPTWACYKNFTDPQSLVLAVWNTWQEIIIYSLIMIFTNASMYNFRIRSKLLAKALSSEILFLRPKALWSDKWRSESSLVFAWENDKQTP